MPVVRVVMNALIDKCSGKRGASLFSLVIQLHIRTKNIVICLFTFCVNVQYEIENPFIINKKNLYALHAMCNTTRVKKLMSC